MSRKAYVDTHITLENIDPILKRFLDGQKETTRKTYSCLMRKLLEYTNHESGAEMLAESDAWGGSEGNEGKILSFLHWLKNQGYSDAYATTACGMVQAFFNKNRKPLNLIKDERMELTERTRVSEDYLFSKADISRMATIGNLKEKYVVLVGASFGLRAEDFAKISYGKIRRAVEAAEKEKTECPIPVDPIATMKERVKAFPFINSDALPIIKAMLDSNKQAKDDDRIWNERPSQLTVVLQVLAKKSGIDPHDSRLRFHNLRKYLSDRLSDVMSESKWKQIVGKKISEGAYISADRLREDYLRAMPSIVVSNGNSEIKRTVTEQNERIAQLEARIEELKTQKAKVETQKAKVEDQTAQSKFEDLLKANPSMVEEFVKWLKRPKQT